MLDWAGSLLVGVAQLVELRVVVPAAAGSSPVAHPFRPANADNCRSGVLVGVLRGVQIAVACTRRAAEPNPGGGRPPGPDVVWTPASRTACTGLLAPDTRPLRPRRSCSCFNRATPLRSVAGCRCALPPKQAQACGASRSSLLVPRRRELPSAMTPAYRSSGRLAPHRARAAARIRPTGQRARARWNRWRALLSTTSSCLDLRSCSSSRAGARADPSLALPIRHSRASPGHDLTPALRKPAARCRRDHRPNRPATPELSRC